MIWQEAQLIKSHIFPCLASKSDIRNNLQALAQRLLQVKNIFPGADAVQIFLQHPLYILKTDITVIASAADRLRAIIPDVNVDRCVILLG